MSDPAPNPENHIALFQRKEVRRAIHDREWWFVITDVVTVLTGSVDAGDYLKKLRKRDGPLSDAFKGGDSLSPPFASNSPPLADASCFNAGKPRASSA